MKDGTWFVYAFLTCYTELDYNEGKMSKCSRLFLIEENQCQQRRIFDLISTMLAIPERWNMI